MNSSSSTRVVFQPASDHQAELMSIYVWPLVFVIIYSILGSIGNIVVIYIYALKMPRTKARVYMLMLGMLNFVNSVFNMPIEAYILWQPLQFDAYYLCKITRGFTFTINNACACVFVVIAIDRVILVYWPLKRRMLTEWYAINGCLISILISCLTSWPGYVFYGTATLPEKLDRVVVLGKTCYIADEYLKTIVWPSTFNKVLFTLMVSIFTLLLVLYIIIGRKIYKVTKFEMNDDVRTSAISKRFSVIASVTSIVLRWQRPRSSTVDTDLENSHDDQDVNYDEKRRTVTIELEDEPEMAEQKTLKPEPETNNRSTRKFSKTPVPKGLSSRRISMANSGASRSNTVSMLLITAAYVCCFLPYLIIVSLRYVDDEFYSNLSKGSRRAYHIFLRTYFLNSALNPFIYCAVNALFRKTLIKTVTSLVKCSKGRS